jgi:hypothetical protein
MAFFRNVARPAGQACCRWPLLWVGTVLAGHHSQQDYRTVEDCANRDGIDSMYEG